MKSHTIFRTIPKPTRAKRNTFARPDWDPYFARKTISERNPKSAHDFHFARYCERNVLRAQNSKFAERHNFAQSPPTPSRKIRCNRIPRSAPSLAREPERPAYMDGEADGTNQLAQRRSGAEALWGAAKSSSAPLPLRAKTALY
jgi:hypothetical protein